MPQASRTTTNAAKSTKARGHRPPRKSVAPLKVRRIRAEIEMKDLPASWVAEQAKIPFPTVSSLLSGRIVNEGKLSVVAKVVSEAPEPEDTQEVR